MISRNLVGSFSFLDITKKEQERFVDYLAGKLGDLDKVLMKALASTPEVLRYIGQDLAHFYLYQSEPPTWVQTRFDAARKTLRDIQTGALPLLKTLMVLDPTIALGEPPKEVKPEPQETVPESFKKASEWQCPAWITTTLKLGGGAAAGDVATGANVAQHFIPTLPSPPDVSAATQWQNAAETLNNLAHSPAVWIAVCGILIAVFAPWLQRRFA